MSAFLKWSALFLFLAAAISVGIWIGTASMVVYLMGAPHMADDVPSSHFARLTPESSSEVEVPETCGPLYVEPTLVNGNYALAVTNPDDAVLLKTRAMHLRMLENASPESTQAFQTLEKTMTTVRVSSIRPVEVLKEHGKFRLIKGVDQEYFPVAAWVHHDDLTEKRGGSH